MFVTQCTLTMCASIRTSGILLTLQQNQVLYNLYNHEMLQVITHLYLAQDSRLIFIQSEPTRYQTVLVYKVYTKTFPRRLPNESRHNTQEKITLIYKNK